MKFTKKRTFPKQLRHWVYRLTGKSGGVLYFINSPERSYSTPVIMTYRSCNDFIRFRYNNTHRIEIFEYDYAAGSKSNENIHVAIGRICENGVVQFDGEKIFKIPTPKNYDAFRLFVENCYDETVFSEL